MSSKSGYLSNLTDRQWSQIEPLLPPQKEGGRNRFVDIRQVVNAIFYRSRTGCSWEMLPKDFPPKSTVYEYYRAWQRDGTWERVHDALREKVPILFATTPQKISGVTKSHHQESTSCYRLNSVLA